MKVRPRRRRPTRARHKLVWTAHISRDLLILRDRQADLESCRLRLTGRDLAFARRSH